MSQASGTKLLVVVMMFFITMYLQLKKVPVSRKNVPAEAVKLTILLNFETQVVTQKEKYPLGPPHPAILCNVCPEESTCLSCGLNSCFSHGMPLQRERTMDKTMNLWQEWS